MELSTLVYNLFPQKAKSNRREGTSVEVFKTNLTTVTEAERLKAALLLHFPDCKICFDLEDCDRILRIEGILRNAKIKDIAQDMGIEVEELPD